MYNSVHIKFASIYRICELYIATVEFASSPSSTTAVLHFSLKIQMEGIVGDSTLAICRSCVSDNFLTDRKRGGDTVIQEDCML